MITAKLIAEKLQSELSDIDGFFDKEITVQKTDIRVSGEVFRSYATSGDNVTEERTSEVTNQQLELFAAQIMHDDFNADIDAEGLQQIELHF